MAVVDTKETMPNQTLFKLNPQIPQNDPNRKIITQAWPEDIRLDYRMKK